MDSRRQVHCLLWEEISAPLNAGERHVVRKTIGPHLIDANEVLFNEAAAYEEILEFVDHDMQRHIASHKILDTPARQMLEKEIKSLVQEIEQQSGATPRDAASCSESSDLESVNASTAGAVAAPSTSRRSQLAELKGQYRNTLDYVLSKNAIQEKLRSGNPSPFPPCSSSCSNLRPGKRVFVDPSLIVRKMAAHLNVSGIEAITDRLRHALAAEHEALLEDVEFLRAYLEASTEMYASVKKNPPSINEMKECGKKLEQSFTSLKHCKTIQSILAPGDRIRGGGDGADLRPCKTPAKTPEVPKRAVRLPKMM